MTNIEVKIYLAAPWKDKELAKAAADKLAEAGYYITSRWHHVHADKPADSSGLEFDPTMLKQEALNDAEDVYAADVFLLLNTQKRGEETSGKAVETGMAMAWGKPVILVGEPTNVFHYLDIHKVSDIEGAIEVINTWVAEYLQANPSVLGAKVVTE